jgi:hypothetical protein
MHRRRRTALARAAAAAALALALPGVLSACSGAAQPAAHIAGTGAPVLGAGAAAQSPGGGVTLPSGLSVSYQFITPSDPVRAGLVQEAEDVIGHYEIAVAAGSPAKLDLDALLSGPAGGQLYSLVRADIKNGTRPTGTIVFFRMTPALAGNLGSVGMCENDQQTAPAEISSGRAAGAAPTGSAALRAWQFGFIKNSAGKYLLDYIDIQAENRACI